MIDELWTLPEPTCGLSLAPVREIVVVPWAMGHSVLLRVNGRVVKERWCYEAADVQMAVQYYAGLYPDAEMREE